MHKYVVALLPLMSRLTLIAIITLSHSVSWLAYDAPDSNSSSIIVAANDNDPATGVRPTQRTYAATGHQGTASKSAAPDIPWWRSAAAHLPTRQPGHWSVSPSTPTASHTLAEQSALSHNAIAAGN